MRLLLAIPDQEHQSTLGAYLSANGFCVDRCESGTSVRDFLSSFEYDVVLMGSELTDINGIDLVRELRDKEDLTPIVMLGPDRGANERVQALTWGGDDFVVWPSSPDELLARLRVQTRRRAGRATNVFTAANLTVDCNTRQVWRDGREIGLTAREFAILECLICPKGQILTRAQIEDHVWSSGYDGGSNVVDVYISYLRRKVDQPFGSRLITTVRGQGYLLRED